MNIAINATVFKNPITGVAKRLWNLYRNIQLSKKDSLFFFHCHTHPIPFKGVVCQKSWLPEFIWNHHTLPRALSKYRIDVFDSIWGGGLPKGKKRCKYLTTIHDLIPLTYGGPLKKIEFRKKIQRNITAADKVICVSHDTKKKLLETFSIPEEKLAVIYNGIDLHVFNDSLLVDPLKGLPEPYLFYVGGFNERKNLQTLIRAFHRFLKKYPSMSLILSGHRNKYFTKKILPLIQNLDLTEKVSLPGYLEEQDLPKYLKQSKGLVYPSLLEGFGMPVVEAMACGKNFVAHASSSLVEIAGKQGILVDCQSQNELEKALEKLIHSPDVESRSSHLALSAKFDWKHLAKDYYEILINL